MKKLLFILLFSGCVYGQKTEALTNDQFYFLKRLNETYRFFPVPEKLNNFYAANGGLERCEFDTTQGQNAGHFIYYPAANKVSYYILEDGAVVMGDVYFIGSVYYKSDVIIKDKVSTYRVMVDQKEVYRK